MANSGHAEEALQYYYKALELNPGYIRARCVISNIFQPITLRLTPHHNTSVSISVSPASISA
jgi:hypothetical protein